MSLGRAKGQQPLPFVGSCDVDVMDQPAENLFVRQYREIYRFVRRRTSSATEAEDVTQEVFAHAARVLAPLSAEAPPELAWLYTVARRRLTDAGRRSAHRRAHASAVPLELVPTSPSEYGPRVARALVAAIGELPEAQREVVVRKALKGQSFQEIASALSVTEAACKMRFLRGLQAVRAELERQGVTP
jgi:RNA polymerase sigma-70 factor, ECF subfamily